jgi:hypothetical protein
MKSNKPTGEKPRQMTSLRFVKADRQRSAVSVPDLKCTEIRKTRVELSISHSNCLYSHNTEAQRRAHPKRVTKRLQRSSEIRLARPPRKIFTCHVHDIQLRRSLISLDERSAPRLFCRKILGVVSTRPMLAPLWGKHDACGMPHVPLAI